MNLVAPILIISFFLIAVIYRLNRAKIIGNIGEKKVSLRLHLLQDEYKIFDDVYLDINGCSVQIDHVVVSKYGVFIIETKNIKGWIFGTDKSEYWIKNMYGKKVMGVVRSTYLIDEKGKIIKALEKVNASDNPKEMLDSID